MSDANVVKEGCTVEETQVIATGEPLGETQVVDVPTPMEETEAQAEVDAEPEVDAETEADAETESDAEPEESEPPAPMSQMLFVDVALVLPSTHPVVVLQEADWPYRELRIPVGGAEGVAIGYAARQVPTPRPLTHEMISRLLDAFDLTLDAVQITSIEGANFVAELIVSGRTGVRSIDCRPSDGIALALRRQISVPIMAAPHVLELAAGAAASGN